VSWLFFDECDVDSMNTFKLSDEIIKDLTALQADLCWGGGRGGSDSSILLGPESRKRKSLGGRNKRIGRTRVGEKFSSIPPTSAAATAAAHFADYPGTIYLHTNGNSFAKNSKRWGQLWRCLRDNKRTNECNERNNHDGRSRGAGYITTRALRLPVIVDTYN